MNELKLKLYGLDTYTLNRFFHNFAKTKFTADQSKVVHERGLWLQPWIVTSVGETQFNYTDPQVIQAVKAEMNVLWDRFYGVMDRCHPPQNPIYVAKRWVDEQKEIQLDYQQTINSRLTEYNSHNAEAAKKLGAAAIAAAVAKLAADTAMLLAGLGIGTATLEAQGLMTLIGTARKLTAINSYGGFFALFGIGMAKSYSTSLAESWSDSRSADLWFTIRQDTVKNMAQNVPSFVNDVYTEQMKRMEKRSAKEANKIKNNTPKPPAPPKPPPIKPGSRPPSGVKMKPPPWQRPGWGKPNSRVPKPPSPPQPQPTAPKPNAPKPGISGGQMLKGAVYIMAFWSACESMAEFKKHAIDLEM